MSEHYVMRRKGERARPIHDTVSLVCDFDEDVYASAVWNLVGDHHATGHQVMAVLWRRRDDDFWQFRWRLRTDAGTPDPFDGADRKSVYAEAYDLVSEEAALERANEFLRVMADLMVCSQCEQHDLKCWGREAIAKFAVLPFAHLQVGPDDPRTTARGGTA